jgi:hypothetical protein
MSTTILTQIKAENTSNSKMAESAITVLPKEEAAQTIALTALNKSSEGSKETPKSLEATIVALPDATDVPTVVETPKAKALKIIDDLQTVTMQCNQLVPLPKGFKSLKNLYSGSVDNVSIDFDKHSGKKQGFKLARVDVKPNQFFPNKVQAEAVFEGRCGATFCMSYDPKKQDAEVELSYRGELPVWIKEGNEKCWLSEKGVPTGKVISSLLIKKLGLTTDNVKTISRTSMNAQTVVDVLHAMIVEGKSAAEAYALCQTSQMSAEFCQNLDAQGLILTSITTSESHCFLEDLLESSNWAEDQKEAFRKQPKIQKIKELTGIDIIRDPIHVPGAVDLTYAVKN